WPAPATTPAAAATPSSRLEGAELGTGRGRATHRLPLSGLSRGLIRRRLQWIRGVNAPEVDPGRAKRHLSGTKTSGVPMTIRPYLGRLDDEDDEDESGKKPDSLSSQMEKALFEARTIMLTGEINDRIARSVSAQLLAYSAVNEKPILLVVSSP